MSIKRIVDQPAEIRQDGDTLIIPLMEEVLVVEKRLMLREELHIKRRRESKADEETELWLRRLRDEAFVEIIS